MQRNDHISTFPQGLHIILHEFVCEGDAKRSTQRVGFYCPWYLSRAIDYRTILIRQSHVFIRAFSAINALQVRSKHGLLSAFRTRASNIECQFHDGPFGVRYTIVMSIHRSHLTVEPGDLGHSGNCKVESGETILLEGRIHAN